ncbi:MAG: class I adenylate-forming enzyme family protein [Bacteroidia bacterium]|nr:class I adenylate-forming enzyme family protein [Bacteroidia bacterium]
MQAVSHAKDYPIYIFKDKEISVRELYRYVLKTINWLAYIGVRQGDRLLISMSNSLEFLCLTYASSYIGCCLMPINPSMSKTQVQELTDYLGASVLLTQEDFNLERLSSFSTFNVETKNLKNNLDLPFLISTTSGSTSKPKPIVLSQKTKVKRAFRTAIELYSLNSNDIIVTSTPMFHTLGFRLSILPVYIGAKGLILDSFDPDYWLYCVNKYGVTFAILVTNQIEAILDYVEGKNISLKNTPLRCIVSSSSSLKQDVRQRLLEAFTGEIHEIYGTSETASATNFDLRKHPDKLLSVGKPIKGVSIKILDNTHKELKPFEVGEIAIKTDLIFSGYLDMPEETRKAFTEDGYFLTGDVGYLDEDGFLYFKGRKRFIYKVGGMNVFPEDIEKVLRQFPDVVDCVVVGKPAQGLIGTELVAFYTGRGNVKTSELRKFCMQRLAPYQVPVKFVQLDELPKNSVGKTDRRSLENMLNRGDV